MTCTCLKEVHGDRWAEESWNSTSNPQPRPWPAAYLLLAHVHRGEPIHKRGTFAFPFFAFLFGCLWLKKRRLGKERRLCGMASLSGWLRFLVGVTWEMSAWPGTAMYHF